MKCDVLCVGHASYDLTMFVDHQPAADEKTFASALTACGGGPAANAAVTVTRMGLKATFVGYAGHDLWGERQVQELRAEGVDTRFVLRGETATPLSVILAKPDGQRSLVNYREKSGLLPADHLVLKEIHPGLILFDGHEPALSMELCRQAKRFSTPTLLDAGSVHAGTQALAPQVDYLVASQKFARQFTGLDDAGAALAQMSPLAPFVVVTLGEHGLIWKSPADNGRMPAFKVNAVDTTGAGDIFHGALAACLVRQIPWEECLRFAGAASALGCTRTGARTGIPYLNEVEMFLRG